MSQLYPHMEIAIPPEKFRKLSKTRLWQLYWQVNKCKVWAYGVHLSLSTNEYERELWRFLNKQWGLNDSLVWNASHCVYF
jgi:hypothetical protein